jgi:hypothetical protein
LHWGLSARNNWAETLACRLHTARGVRNLGLATFCLALLAGCDIPKEAAAPPDGLPPINTAPDAMPAASQPDLAGPQSDLAGPACIATTQACQPGDQCCSGVCGQTSLGQVCCGEAGARCTTANGEDCCGALWCINGTCALPAEKVLNVEYQVQQTSYWCGPAATRIALSARMTPPSQATLAAELGTTVNGTDWIGQVTSVLSQHLGAGRYRTTEMPNDPPTQAQSDHLWSDITFSIDNGYAIVANIVAPASNHPPGYPNYTIYHYFTVIGYNRATKQVKIADPANFGGNQLYWLTFDQLATLIPPKGYSTLANP